MKLRNASKNDLEKLIDLMDQLGYQTRKETLLRNLDHYNSSVLVAEMEGKVVGCLAYHILPQFHSEKTHMAIVTLVVDRAHRSRGVGKSLLKEAERIAEERGCAVIELTSGKYRIPTGAHDFYRAHGYSSESESIYFRKELGAVKQ